MNTETFPTLYKRTTTGKIQIWFAETEGNKYRTTSGQIDGKKTTADWTVCEGKNVGKANETSPEQQARLEVEAMYVKQRKKDYRNTPDAVDEITRFKPMLAVKWEDVANKIGQSIVHIQPKLDGMRCIARADGLWSRTGEPIISVPHIWEELAPLFAVNPRLIIDGELYNHDLKDDFNKIISAAKKKKPTADDLKISRQNIQYWVYDLPSFHGDFEKRWEQLKSTVIANQYIRFTETLQISVTQVEETAAEYIERGYEGAMVRLSGFYENKRSKFLIKWKEMQDEEFLIQDIQTGLGNKSGIAARAVLSLPDGRTFSAGIIGNEQYCLELLQSRDQHIGKMGTVVFQNYTPDGIPRFPKFKAIRDYE